MSKILGIESLNMIMPINMFAETLIWVELFRQVNGAWSTGKYLWTNQRPVCAVQDCISMSRGCFFVFQSYWMILNSLSIFTLLSTLLSPPPPFLRMTTIEETKWQFYLNTNQGSACTCPSHFWHQTSYTQHKNYFFQSLPSLHAAHC